jgi:formylglycine-generating enzyme required for sulfatase activity
MTREKSSEEQLHELQNAIQELETLLQEGALSPETAERALAPLRHSEAHLQALLKGTGAIAQGVGNTALHRAVQVVGNVQGNLTVWPDDTRASEIDPKDLRRSYLQRVLSETGVLLLGEIDPAAGASEPSLRLRDLYTGLCTLSSLETPLPPASPAYSKRRTLSEAPRRSALERLDESPRLVLLGEAGSGKSIFINFVGYCLAGELLEDPSANLGLLTAPLRDEQGKAGGTLQLWRHGALLPLRIVLRDFAARLAGSQKRKGAAALTSYIQENLDRASLSGFFPLLEKMLLQGQVLLLLDGLDEVPEADGQREQVWEVIDDFLRSFGGCRALLTCRTYSYRNQRLKLRDFDEATLAPFSRGQIRDFVVRWYSSMVPLGRIDAESVEGKVRSLCQTILNNDRLLALAQRPLLLTLIVSLHVLRGKTLPEEREHLYECATDLLLDLWEQRLIVRSRGDLVLVQPSLSQFLVVGREKVLHALEALAYEMHMNQLELTGTADLPERVLVHRLLDLCPHQEIPPAKLVEYLEERSGILVPAPTGGYTFPHRTFQEYLAARHLSVLEFPGLIADLARKDPNRWREVVLLAGTKRARDSASSVWQLVDELCWREPDDPASGLEDAWGAQLAGQILTESIDLIRPREAHSPKQERLRRWLCTLLRDSRFPTAERILAGNVLARLGDCRFTQNFWSLPADSSLGFIEIPAGSFLMGTKEEASPYDEESPQHSVDLPTFYIARYPVTVQQFREFVRDCRWEEADTRCLLGPANHPVTYVSWFDAIAYCKWLTEKLKASLASPSLGTVDWFKAQGLQEVIAGGRLSVSLPSEAEWERAARDTDARIFPWGEQAGPERANSKEAGVSTTSPVGCFPLGASLCGCEDMSGNVWEWTRTVYGEYPYPSGAEARSILDGLSNARVRTRGVGFLVLRGGSYTKSFRDLRCANRNGDIPEHIYADTGFRIVLRET